MTDTNKADHWKSLASEVGAEVPPEVFERREKPIEEVQENTGSPVEAEDKPAAIPAAVKPPNPSRQETSQNREGQWESLAGELGLAFPSLEPTDSEADPVQLDEEILSGEYDLFESTVDEAALDDETSPSVDREKELDDADADSASEFDEQEVDRETPGQGDEDSEETGRKRKRRRRRRRKPRQSKEDGEPESKSDDDEDETAEDDDSDDESDTGSNSDRDDDNKSKHRKIPTWEESISVVVQRNIELHSKSSGGSKPSGGGRQGRGRGKRS